MAESDGERLVELAPSEEWAEALRAAPRHMFVPERAWTVQHGLIDRRGDPETWWSVATGRDAIVTQIADGEVELTAENVARNPHRYTSSCSAPSLVVDMLRLLDPYPGDQVLEIGTGTGWTAGLLSAKLGAGNVTSIEVDEQVAAQAKAHLDQAGFDPRLIVGDGAVGDPEGAPFDRVHVTCGVVDIPYTWVEQTRPGGIIVVPWSPSIGTTNLRTRLTVTGDAAIGRFHGDCAFMKLRSQRETFTPIPGEVHERTSVVDPRRINAAGAALWVSLAGLSPGLCTQGGTYNPVDGTFRIAVHDDVYESHAIAIQPPDGGGAEVEQRGPRKLWDELEAGYLSWVAWGEPGIDRFGLTVDAEAQHIWLDSPANTIA